MPKGPSYTAAAAIEPATSAKAQSRQAGSRRACAFFPPSVAPVLDGGKGDQDAVVAPEVPARRAVGHTGLDHEPDRPLNPTMGLRTARWGQSGEVRVQVRAARRTGVLRIRDHASPWTPYVESPHVVQ